MNYVLAHDLGTSGNKVTLFDENGALVAEATVNYPTNYFNSNWAEQNPNDWWASVCAGTRSALQNIDPRQVSVVSFSGHMMGALCVDRKGVPLRPSIIWSDQRAQKEFLGLQRELGEEKIFRITGHRGSGNYSLPKLMWVKNNEPDIYAKTYKTLHCKEYIISKLTGRFFSEPTDGIGTLAMDITSCAWSDEILLASGVAKDKFPDVLKSVDIAGKVTREAAAATGLAEGTPVVMGGGDGVVAGIGTGAVALGDSFMSFGSSAWVSTVSTGPAFDSKRRNTNWPHIVDGLYLNDGVMQSAGGSYTWARKALSEHEPDNHGEMEKLLAETKPGANGILFLPYLLGERCPWWNPDAKGAFVGLTMETTKAEMLRAVLEGVAHNMAYIADVLRGNGLPLRDIVVIGGGARGTLWREILADAMDATIHIPTLLEGATSLGAAITGGVGIGIYPDFTTAAKKFITIKDIHRPNAERTAFYRERRKLFVDCYEAMEPLFSKF
jgi:Sugar (pentulose and hexulose) kinases